MPTSAADTEIAYTGNGVTTVFAFPFEVVKASHFQATLDAISTTAYTLAGLGVDAGGTCTFTVAPLTGVAIVLVRIAPYARTDFDYQEGGQLAANTLDDDVDRSVMLIQQIATTLKRVPKVKAGNLTASLTLTPISSGLLGWSGSQLANLDLATVTPVGVAMSTLGQQIVASVSKTTVKPIIGVHDVNVFDHMTAAQIADVEAKTALIDVTAAFNAAAATGKRLIQPDGHYYIKDRINLVNGQVLQGDGRTESMFIIKSDFNMAATGVVRLGTGEPGAQLFDVGFKFTQADQGVRANVTAYPPAIDGIAIPRFIIDRIRIEGGFNGLRATGNSGGSYIGFIEFGCLNIAVDVTGHLDFTHGTNWHFWPFGIINQATLFSGVYYDGVTQALKLGAMDGFRVESLSTFRSWVEVTNVAGAVPMTIGGLKLDGDGARLSVAGGILGIGQLYETKTVTPVITTIAVSAGHVEIDQILSVSSTSAPTVTTTGTGKVQINGGRVAFNNLAFSPFASLGGKLSLNNIEMVPVAVGAYTQPHMLGNGGTLQANNCHWPVRGASTGTAVQVIGDLIGHSIQNNQIADWGYTVPANHVLGNYGPNAIGVTNWTPTVKFATVGNSVFTYVTQAGQYREVAGGIYFECRLVFNTNAYTTAVGAFTIQTLPMIKGPGIMDRGIVNIGRIALVTLTAGNTMVAASVVVSTGVIDLHQSGSALALSPLTIANIPPSTNNIELVLSGFIPQF